MTRERGRRLGIDVGAVRVGVAMCDPDGILATPVETVARGERDGTDEPAVRRIAELVAEHDVVGVVLGLPRNLRGEDGPAAQAALEFAAALEAGLEVPVELTDERMTTVVAARQLSGRGVKGRRQRAVVDQAAAVQILQGWLDAGR
ncbi:MULTISPECIES: Holliday junction resolvase RuvX [Pseudonocardia]|uniref:Putative pre-16S rRNA nuclease n=2 Tax=Pseudonocardia TaxID=1847 RepID=A0A1Y2N2Q5_PSEAH|nr:MULTISPECIES: Holliday junction resolvase RuvX [Pseudonocardia]OSY41710.1 putative Holliday junction resolvase [Pseudonocardia autotrophica]TDN71238.1 putative Holliday junction resolvase [Pseudonocardia autotrophica]BBG01909.1 putative pre-16S rRNA nuclease [Pseudonocardia autotrophica]GEC23074.1 putative pre-16S rRNA nuclease [Pseudonocardia saturnea]